MRKRTILFIAALLAVSGAAAAGTLDRLSFRLTPGGFLPVGGHYNDEVRLRSVVSVGAGLTAGLRYKVNDYFYLGADYGLTWMKAKSGYRPFDYKETGPALNVMMLTLNSTFVISTGFGINPYFTVGAGLYPWRFSQTWLWGNPWPALADPTGTFAMNSLGFNTGLGLEKHLSSHLSAYLEVTYHYVFARNPVKLGTDDFTQQDFLGINLGVSFALGKE
jgi:hypothetical protein